MKTLIATVLLSISITFASLGSEMTNGVFCVDNPVTCVLVAENGTTATNQLTAGKTYMVGNALAEMRSANNSTVYFSGGPTIGVSSNSLLTINSFDEEIKNIESTPSRADFGNHNLSLTFSEGDYVVIYSTSDKDSSFTVNTPIATYKINNGKFLFHVTDKKCLVYVIDGMLEVYGDKKKADPASKGKLAIAGQIEDTIANTMRDIKQTEQDTTSKAVAKIDIVANNFQFFVISNHVVGVRMK